MRFWFIQLANAAITHIFFWMNASCPYFLLTFSFAFITILLPYLHPKTVYIRITVTGHLVSQFRIFSISYKTWNAAPSSYIIVGGGEGMYLLKTQYMLFSIVDYHLLKTSSIQISITIEYVSNWKPTFTWMGKTLLVQPILHMHYLYIEWAISISIVTETKCAFTSNLPIKSNKHVLNSAVIWYCYITSFLLAATNTFQYPTVLLTLIKSSTSKLESLHIMDIPEKQCSSQNTQPFPVQFFFFFFLFFSISPFH